ncbi:hypothetical protein BDW59DRAFT_140253 [Aspergillus cavernicola]|uniref:Protein kinase domain-containing protein n=1 Tax=Aspergillus cavernicola TaxID=176166 RepID=A0ABR4IUR9_9EURO
MEILTHPPLRNHANIISLLSFSWDAESPGFAPMLVVEYAELGDLPSFLKSQELADHFKWGLCVDVVHGLEAVHASMIVHGDVKADNVLIFKDRDRKMVAKISDFGHAILEYAAPVYRGTPIYNAPEVRLQSSVQEANHQRPLEHHDLFKCDVFSLGLLLFEVLLGGPRYYELPETEKFRKKLMTKTDDSDDIVRYADEFLDLVSFPRSLKSLCHRIFEHTIRTVPAKRLPEGWDGIKDLFWDEYTKAWEVPQKKAVIGSWEPRYQGRMQMAVGLRASQRTDTYSVLEIAQGVRDLSSHIMGEDLYKMLRASAENGQSREIKARASFELSVLSAGNKHISDDLEGKTLYWMAHAASFGDEMAILLGQRLFDANKIRHPDVFLGEKRLSVELTVIDQYLDRLPPEDFYHNAVRLLWPRELKKSSLMLMAHIERWPVQMSTDTGAKTAYFDVHKAVLMQDYSRLEGSIQKGDDLNSRTEDGRTPLYFACMLGDTRGTLLLLQWGADASIGDNVNILPLHFLVMFPANEIPTIAILLVKAGGKVHASTKADCFKCFDPLGLKVSGTPITWAAACRNQVATAALLALGGSALDGIEIAVSTLCADTLETIKQVNKGLGVLSALDQRRVLIYIGNGNSNDFQRWCIHGSLYKTAHESVIHSLDKWGFFEDGALNLTEQLQSAVFCGCVDTAQELIRRGADVNYCGGDSTRLLDAVWATEGALFGPLKATRMVNLLLEHGASALPPEDNPLLPFTRDACKRPPLYSALQGILRFPIIEPLAARMGPHLNDKYDGETPLHVLSQGETDRAVAADIARLFIDLGADPDIETDHERKTACCQTALGAAVCNSNLALAALYLGRGYSTRCGVTGGHEVNIIHWAVWCVLQTTHLAKESTTSRRYRSLGTDNYMSFMKYLLTHPVVRERDLINGRNWQGVTPLVMATNFFLPFCVKLLLQQGADLSILCNGKTAVEIFESKVQELRDIWAERHGKVYAPEQPTQFDIITATIRELFARHQADAGYASMDVDSEFSQNTNQPGELQRSAALQAQRKSTSRAAP